MLRNDKIKLYMFSTDATIVLNYVVHVSNNVTFPSTFDPWLVESNVANSINIEDRLYIGLLDGVCFVLVSAYQ